MKVVEINSVPYGSTGNIARKITDILKNNSNSSFFFYSWTKVKKYNTKSDEKIIGTFFEKLLSIMLERLTGYAGHFSIIGTYKLVKELKKIKPDIVHIHNLHEGYLNYKLFFKYLKNNNISVVWTLHDCWSFTGHCPHFELSNCNKWINGCENCPIYKEYPKSLFDNSKKMYKYKKKWFTYLDSDKMTIVTPSKWLSNYVKKSYLNKYNIKVINNGIDLDSFKPIENNFREKYKIEDKIILLGVAMDWGTRKGLDVFIKLANDLPDKYKIVLVGTNEQIDKILPSNIISIHKTHSKKELVKIYSSSDIFINPTREENFPTVNIEALACGTPVITYNTGGSPEIIDDKCGIVIEKDDYNSLLKTIISFDNKNKYKSHCLERSKLYDAQDKFDSYRILFENINNK